MTSPCPPIPQDSQRLDVWLFRTRQYKQRSDAARDISRGALRLIRHDRTERIEKSHFGVRTGDILIFQRGSNLRKLKVTGLPARRGPAIEAQSFYEEWQDVE